MMRKFLTLVFRLTVLAQLSACAGSAVAPATVSPQVPEAWARGGTGQPLSPNWIVRFDDPQLTELISVTLQNNYSLGQERARLAAAREAVVIAGAARYPDLNLTISTSRRSSRGQQGNTFGSGQASASLGTSWTVDLWGQLAASQQAAQLGFAAQQASLAAAEREVAGTLAAQYFDGLTQHQLLEVATRRLQNASESHDIVASGYRQGLNEALDLYLARNELERQQANLAEQEQMYAASIGELQLVLARYPDGNMLLEQDVPVINDPVPVGLPASLLTRRPDIQQAWLSLLAADANLAAAHKARFPSLSLVASTGRESTEVQDLVDSGVSVWSTAFSLAQPLFAAGRLRALEKQALAQLRVVEQEYLELVYRAFADVENAISQEAALKRQYEALLAAEQNSTAALDLALEQYQRGLVSYTTVLESQRQAFDAEATVVELRNQRVQNRISLHLALGGEFAVN